MLEDREIYSYGPDDEVFKEILKNARRKLERPYDSNHAVQKDYFYSISKVVAKPEIAARKSSKNNFSECFVESLESTYLLDPKNMKIALQEKDLLR